MDPVEIVEDEKQGLDLALAEQQAFDGIERSLPALRRIATLPSELVDGGVEKGEKGGQRGPEGLIEGKELAGDLLADPPGVVAVLDLEVRLEEADDWQVGGGLTVG